MTSDPDDMAKDPRSRPTDATTFVTELSAVPSGDDIEVQVWNPQSGQGPAICQVVAVAARRPLALAGEALSHPRTDVWSRLI